ncbi:hypothetical protein [Piscinibacter sakaiensis]|uniref:SPOR domain-containing protein n=1 Tax=Piscinibacter sakaiensis TaxID=1547922 RepID=A0A0K8NVQ4_PISS1|nr:hypothetical protein [Piscinibacter sakaiensis]GAP34472.1 hypothetical protein ISF6_4647 [Piscinibacter sakaiensis]
MLRALVAALLVANLVFFAWTQGWLDAVTGVPARGEREPERLARQQNPERIQLLARGPGAASAPFVVPAPSAAASAGAADVAAAASAAASGAATAAAAGASSAVAGASAPSRPAGAAAPVTAAASAGARPAPAASAAPAPGTAPTVAAATAPSAPSATAASSAAAAPACLEAGPYAATELASAEALLKQRLAAGVRWTTRQVAGSSWMIYMGPYPDTEWLERKKAELGRIRGGIAYEDVQSPPELARGLSLGRFPTQAAANATLAQYRLRGIRTARVVSAGPGPAQSFLRVPAADAVTQSQLAALRPAGRTFTRCPAGG